MSSDIYEKFIKQTRVELEKFKYKRKYTSTTGIEEDLQEPFLSQIIELNRYMRTDSSTNDPRDPYFQGMFITGYIHKKYITHDFLRSLKKLNLSYRFSRVKRKDHGKVYEHYSDNKTDRELREVFHDMIGKWWFFKKSDPEDPMHYVMKDLIYFIRNNNIKLPEQFRKNVLKIGFIRAFDNLSKEEIELGKYILKNYYKHEIDSTYLFEIGSDPLKISSPIYTSGEVLSFQIHNLHDPTDRNIYSNLLKLFIKNHGYRGKLNVKQLHYLLSPYKPFRKSPKKSLSPSKSPKRRKTI